MCLTVVSSQRIVLLYCMINTKQDCLYPTVVNVQLYTKVGATGDGRHVITIYIYIQYKLVLTNQQQTGLKCNEYLQLTCENIMSIQKKLFVVVLIYCVTQLGRCCYVGSVRYLFNSCCGRGETRIVTCPQCMIYICIKNPHMV